MVTERRYLFEIQDISTLIYTCSQCNHEVHCQLSENYVPDRCCPSCSNDLVVPQSDLIDPNEALLRNLRHVLSLKSPRVKLKLVVTEVE